MLVITQTPFLFGFKLNYKNFNNSVVHITKMAAPLVIIIIIGWIMIDSCLRVGYSNYSLEFLMLFSFSLKIPVGTSSNSMIAANLFYLLPTICLSYLKFNKTT